MVFDNSLLRYFAHFGRIQLIRLNVCRSRKKYYLLKRRKIRILQCVSLEMVGTHLIGSNVIILRLSTKQLIAQYIPVLELYIAAIFLAVCVCLHWTIIKGCSNNTHWAVLDTLHDPYTVEHSAGCSFFLYGNCNNRRWISDLLTPTHYTKHMVIPRIFYFPYISWNISMRFYRRIL
jgi:hypothetical protein